VHAGVPEPGRGKREKGKKKDSENQPAFPWLQNSREAFPLLPRRPGSFGSDSQDMASGRNFRRGRFFSFEREKTEGREPAEKSGGEAPKHRRKNGWL